MLNMITLGIKNIFLYELVCFLSILVTVVIRDSLEHCLGVGNFFCSSVVFAIFHVHLTSFS